MTVGRTHPGRRWILLLLIIVSALLWTKGYGESQRQAPSSAIDRLLPGNCDEQAAALDITAERMTFDQHTRTFVFEEHVQIRRCSMTILCDRLQVLSHAETEEAERIIATGNVKIQHGTRHVVAERAEYFTTEQRIVLTGNPRAWDTQDRHEMAGDEIIILLLQDHVTVKRAHVRFHPRKASPEER
jgi:lipopolysaccharide transport protein LptA